MILWNWTFEWKLLKHSWSNQYHYFWTTGREPKAGAREIQNASQRLLLRTLFAFWAWYCYTWEIILSFFGKSTVRSYLFAIRRKISCMGVAMKRALVVIWKTQKKQATFMWSAMNPLGIYWFDCNTASVEAEHNIKISISIFKQVFKMPSWRGIVRYMGWTGLIWLGWQTAKFVSYGVYYSPGSFLTDFRFLRLSCWSEHWKSRNTTVGTIPFLYLCLQNIIFHGLILKKYCAIIESTRRKKMKLF